MRRVVILKMGKRNIQLLRVLGMFIVIASVLLMISSISDIFFRVQQLGIASENDAFAKEVIGLPASAVTVETSVGYIIAPMGYLFLWFGLFVIGVIVYKSGSLFLPIEEEVKEMG